MSSAPALRHSFWFQATLPLEGVAGTHAATMALPDAGWSCGSRVESFQILRWVETNHFKRLVNTLQMRLFLQNKANPLLRAVSVSGLGFFFDLSRLNHGCVMSCLWRGAFLIGTLLQHSLSFILSTNNSTLFQIRMFIYFPFQIPKNIT